jgi:uncharacterized lipoprotein YajG
MRAVRYALLAGIVMLCGCGTYRSTLNLAGTIDVPKILPNQPNGNITIAYWLDASREPSRPETDR